MNIVQQVNAGLTTPSELGFRMPAEWEPHEATWISWPHKEASWPGKFAPVHPIMVQLIQALVQSETVRINVMDDDMADDVRSKLAAAGVHDGYVLHRHPTNDAWCRDHGALFVVREGETGPELAATGWGYNAWGGKYGPWDKDDLIPERMAEVLDVPLFDGGMILEGGSIDVNGAGLLLTTEACLLNPNRNPTLSQQDIEKRLRTFFGVEQILWLGEGIVGDDTDGHIDDLARFVGPRTIVTVVEKDPADANYAILQDNLQRLRQMTDLEGNPLEIVELPMPGPIEFEGERLPASYANFYVANQCVILPTYRDPRDAEAHEILQRCFPDRRVIDIDSYDLSWGLGSFHCLTQQVPRGAAVRG